MKGLLKNTNIIIISLALCLFFIFFSVFYRINSLKNKNNTRLKQDNSQIYNPQITEENPPPVITKPLNYTLKLENGYLNFYLNSGTETILIDSSAINVSLYPENDIRVLSESITVDTLEEGINIIEDFTSWKIKKNKDF